MRDTKDEIQSMMETDGWKNVVRPSLDEKLSSLTSALLEETNHVKMLSLQAAANAISNLLNLIEFLAEVPEDVEHP